MLKHTGGIPLVAGILGAMPGSLAPAAAQAPSRVVLEQAAEFRPTGTAPGVMPFFERPVVTAGGQVFSIRMPERKLVSITGAGRTLSVREVAFPSPVSVPFALAADGGSHLWVLDPASQRVVRFTVAGPVLRAAGSFAVGDGASDLCVMNGRIYVHTPGAARPITAYSEAGAAIMRFGQQVGAGSARRKEAMSKGRLLCLGAARRLLVATNLTGEVQSYTDAGRLLWARRARGIVALPILDSGGGTITMMSPRNGYHVLLSLTALRPGSVLVQYGFRPAAQEIGFRSVESRELSLDSGAESGARTDLPGWLTGVGMGRALSLDQSAGNATLWRVNDSGR